MKKLSSLGSFACALAIFGTACRHVALGNPLPSGRGDPVILSAELVQRGAAVAIRTAEATLTLDPGRGDTALAGYEQLLVSDDHRAAAWLEDQGAPISDASYAEPTGAWLFAHGHLIGALGCDGGEPFKIRFSDEGGELVLVCSSPHGPAQTHELLFDTRSGRCLSELFLDSGKRQPCRDRRL